MTLPSVCECGHCALLFVCRMETVEHALGCAVRIIRTLLGPSAVDDSKVAFGMSLSVLGCTLESDISMFPNGRQSARSCQVFVCALESASLSWLQVQKWIALIQCALEDGIMKPGTASKLSGKLSREGYAAVCLQTSIVFCTALAKRPELQ